MWKVLFLEKIFDLFYTACAVQICNENFLKFYKVYQFLVSSLFTDCHKCEKKV